MTSALPSDLSEVCLLNAAEVAKILSISQRYAYHLMASGVIHSVRIGRAIRVLKADLLAYVASLPRNDA